MNSSSPPGSILGHGIDVVDLATFRAMIGLSVEKQALGRYFTAAELDASGEGEGRLQRLAGRFAAKEAVLKTLGVGWGDGLSFADIEIVVDPLGAPRVVLHRRASSLAAERGVCKWLVSTAHTATSAMASVIALS
jgi:holo-[acyl-carrier protein] synthase